MKELANSPLELYEKAYRLHYDEGRIPEACRIYKAVINEFPDSNECGYAVIQLEKILAQSVSERITVSSRWVSVLAVIAIVVSACCCAAVVLMSNTYVKSVGARLSAVSLMSQAIAKMSVGKDKDALDLLADAKSALQNRDIAPYLLSADIYMKKQQYGRAMAEYDTVRKLPGGETIAKEEMVKAKAEEENAMRRPPVIEDTPVVQKAAESVENSRPEPVMQSAPPAREIKAKVKKESAPAAAARPARPKKAQASHSDSVSFF